MGVFFIYILKSSVCLVLFYLFFRLLLSKETFHRFNRVALLGVLFFSLLIPCIEVTTRHQVEVQQAMLTIEQLLMMAELEVAPVEADVAQETVAISWVQIVLLVYLAGILFLACRNIYSLICLLRLISSGKRDKLEKGITLVVHNQEIAPFSWMKYIVISQKDQEENGREILIHEIAHIHHRHSIDLLVADICIFFQWFNPGAWLLKQELQNIHEYEADETVINEGVNAKEYQLLLIKKAVGTRLYSMANSFNHSKLKKRITMMLKEKSNPWARLKYLYVLPLAAIAVTAFARPEISERMEEISAVKVNDLAEIMQEEMPKDTAKSKPIVVKGYKAEIPKVKVEDEDVKIVFEVIEQMPEFPGGVGALRKYISNKASEVYKKEKSNGFATLYLGSSEILVNFTVAETGKVEDAYIARSNEAAFNEEALRIVRTMPNWIPGKQRGRPVAVKYSVPIRFSSEALEVRGAKFHTNGKEPLVLIDGQESTLNSINTLDPNTIESISVLKDSTAISVYGKRGAEGVILVTTQKGQKAVNSNKNSYTSVAEKDKKEAIPNFRVSGTVIDNMGNGKQGVSIIIPGTYHGTITDKDGYFRINAFEGGDLHFSFVGYKSVKIPVSSTMKVQLEQEIIKL